MYRNATDFCMLIIGLANLPNSLRSSKFFNAVFRFSVYKIMSSSNGQFNFVLSDFDVFYFPCLLSLRLEYNPE